MRSTSGCSGRARRWLEERVGPGREDRIVSPAPELEQHLGALGRRSSGAGRDHPLGPPERRKVEQLIGVAGRLEEPLRDVAGLDQAPRARNVRPGPARSQAPSGRAGTTDRRRSALGGPGCVQLQEEPLRPAVVLRLVGGELARPVDRPADRLHRPRIASMFRSTISRGWPPSWIAAFSAGRPNESNPIGRSTSKPLRR